MSIEVYTLIEWLNPCDIEVIAVYTDIKLAEKAKLEQLYPENCAIEKVFLFGLEKGAEAFE